MESALLQLFRVWPTMTVFGLARTKVLELVQSRLSKATECIRVNRIRTRNRCVDSNAQLRVASYESTCRYISNATIARTSNDQRSNSTPVKTCETMTWALVSLCVSAASLESLPAAQRFIGRILSRAAIQAF